MDLHHRHHALQACALLTELPVQNRTVFFRRLTCDLNMKFRNQLKGAASTGFIQMAHNLESEPLYVHTYTAALKMAEEVRLELTRPLLNPRFSRPLPLDQLGLLFLKHGAGIGTRNRVNSLEGCVATSAYPQNRFFNLSNLLQTGCGGWTRTSDLQLMRLESYLCYTPLLWGADKLGSRLSAIDCQK